MASWFTSLPPRAPRPRVSVCRLYIPYEQRFLSCMAFSVYEVIRVACLSRSWFGYSP